MKEDIKNTWLGYSSEWLLSVLTDDLTFYGRITRLYSKANQKLGSLARVSIFMTIQKTIPAYEFLNHISVYLLPFRLDEHNSGESIKSRVWWQ